MIKKSFLAFVGMVVLAACGKNEQPPLCFISSTLTESFTYTDNRWTSGVKAGVTYTVSYDNSNRITGFDYFNGQYIAVTYNDAGKPGKLVTTNKGAVILTRNIAYTASGQVNSVTAVWTVNGVKDSLISAYQYPNTNSHNYSKVKSTNYFSSVNGIFSITKDSILYEYDNKPNPLALLHAPFPEYTTDNNAVLTTSGSIINRTTYTYNTKGYPTTFSTGGAPFLVEGTFTYTNCP